MANGADAKGNFHDTDGQFVSIGTLFERERVQHDRDHENERLVARETAQRLEREVEETAQRLSRMVEVEAGRLEQAVKVALAAVGETAHVHSEAHNREHQAHERIHTVEKVQVDKAEQAMNRRLEGMNEFRSTLSDQAGRMVSREFFDASLKPILTITASAPEYVKKTELETKLTPFANQVSRELFDAQAEKVNQIEKRMAYYAGAAAVLGIIGGALFNAIVAK